jgi:two-component system sensor histidine kinase/response regulator
MNQLEIICFNLEQELRAGDWQQESVDRLGSEVISMVELVTLGLNLQHNEGTPGNKFNDANAG